MSWSLSALSASVSSLASSVQASVTALVAEQKQKLAEEQAKLEQTKQKQEQAEQAKQRGAYPLWTIYNEDQIILEAELKERILQLATDIKTWQIPDPREQFSCTMEFLLPFVVEALKHDKNLERRQYRLVPGKMSEEKFWRLYMYQVERLRAEMQVGSLFTPPKHFRLPDPASTVALPVASSASSSSSSTPSKPARSMDLLSVEEPHTSDSDYVSDDYVKVAANKKLAAAAAALSSSTSTSPATSTSTSTSTSSSTTTSSTSTTRPSAAKPTRTDDDDLEELESMLADVDVSGEMLSGDGDAHLNELNDLVIEEELP